jgi:ketosteroid isomerase-like protein
MDLNEGLRVLGELRDRQEILDCVQRFCRGIDRNDKALALSAYHPDAVDFHTYAGGAPEAFVTWGLSLQEKYLRGLHNITNHLVELDGDTAHGETYYCFTAQPPDGEPRMAWGRYIDRFERRDGRWAIAVRHCVIDVMSTSLAGPAELELIENGGTTKDRRDPSYMRPLTIDPALLERLPIPTVPRT